MPDAQEPVRPDEEFKVRLDFLEGEMPQAGIVFQRVQVGTTFGLEADEWIEARLAAGHAHDLQHGSLVELVVELVFVNKHQVGGEREIKLAVAKRQTRQAAGDVTASVRQVISEEGLVGALAVGAHRLGVLVELPLVSLQAADGPGDVVEIRSAARLDLFGWQFVDEVERGDMD